MPLCRPPYAGHRLFLLPQNLYWLFSWADFISPSRLVSWKKWLLPYVPKDFGIQNKYLWVHKRFWTKKYFWSINILGLKLLKNYFEVNPFPSHTHQDLHLLFSFLNQIPSLYLETKVMQLVHHVCWVKKIFSGSKIFLKLKFFRQ